MNSDTDSPFDDEPLKPLISTTRKYGIPNSDSGISKRRHFSPKKIRKRKKKFNRSKNLLDFNTRKRFFSEENETSYSKFRRKFGRYLNAESVFKRNFNPLPIDLKKKNDNFGYEQLSGQRTSKTMVSGFSGESSSSSESSSSEDIDPILIMGKTKHKPTKIKYLKSLLKTSLRLNDPRLNMYAGTAKIRLPAFLLSVFVTSGIFYGIILSITLVSIFVPVFSITFGTFLTALVFIIVIAGWIVFKQFLYCIPIVNYVSFILLEGLFIFMIFIYFSNVSFVSLLILHGIIGIYSVGFIILVFFTGSQFISIKNFSSGFSSITFVIIVLLVFLYFDYFTTHPALMLYIFFAADISVMLQYADEITELFKGVAGSYKKFSILEGILVVTKLITMEYIVLITILKVFKLYGFILPMITPWRPFIVGISLPASWFSSL